MTPSSIAMVAQAEGAIANCAKFQAYVYGAKRHGALLAGRLGPSPHTPPAFRRRR